MKGSVDNSPAACPIPTHQPARGSSSIVDSIAQRSFALHDARSRALRLYFEISNFFFFLLINVFASL